MPIDIQIDEVSKYFPNFWYVKKSEITRKKTDASNSWNFLVLLMKEILCILSKSKLIICYDGEADDTATFLPLPSYFPSNSNCPADCFKFE